MGDRHPQGTAPPAADPGPPEFQPGEDRYCEIWARVYLGPHNDHGGWWMDREEQPVCVCGASLADQDRAAA